MTNQTLGEKIREFIGRLGWKIFLWSIHMTQEQYLSQFDQHWIPVKDKLPKVRLFHKGKSCNVVLACHKEETIPVCGSRFQTCATPYMHNHPEQYLYWMEIPPLPEEVSSGEL